MLLFRLTTRVDLLPTQGVHSLSRSLRFSILVCWTVTLGVTSATLSSDSWIGDSFWSEQSDASESSESINTSAGLYSLLSWSRLIPSTSLEALTARALLTCANRRCQRRIHLFWLTRCVGRPLPVMAIARARSAVAIALGWMIIVAMAFPEWARSSVKKFRVVFAWAITLLCCIRVIAIGLSWYMIPVSRSWPSEIRFKSHPGASATFFNSMLFPSANGINTLPISSVRMTCLAAVTKSMLLALRLLNRLRSLQRWRDAHESRNQVLLALTSLQSISNHENGSNRSEYKRLRIGVVVLFSAFVFCSLMSSIWRVASCSAPASAWVLFSWFLSSGLLSVPV